MKEIFKELNALFKASCLICKDSGWVTATHKEINTGPFAFRCSACGVARDRKISEKIISWRDAGNGFEREN